MESKIGQEIQADPQLRPVVEAANEVLLKGVGRAPHPPRAEWKLVRDQAESTPVELELTFHDEAVSRRFSPAELSDLLELRYDLSNLWGDLILKAKRRTIGRLIKNLEALADSVALQEV